MSLADRHLSHRLAAKYGTGGRLGWQSATLYPLLHTMEEEELLTSYEEEFLGKTRKYYRITKNGEKLLKCKEEEWEEYSSAVTAVLKWEG